MKTLSSLTLTGNIIYILWIIYNGIDEGFQSIHTVQAVALIGLIFLLALNSVVLLKRK